MKKILLLCSTLLILTACNEKIEDKNKEKDNQISYTNKYECIREENLTLNEMNTSEENDKTITIKKESDLANEYNKEKSKMTMESIKKDYEETLEIYKCS